MHGSFAGALTLALSVAFSGATSAAAQDSTSLPCRVTVCALNVDWTPGTAPTTVDRRYGTVSELEQRVIDQLIGAGYRFERNSADAQLTIRIRPQLIRAMCDVMAGTNPDMSCRTFGEARIEVLDVKPGMKAPRSIRVRGQCGADQVMDVPRFSEYVAAMLDYEFRRAAGEDPRRPPTRC